MDRILLAEFAKWRSVCTKIGLDTATIDGPRIGLDDEQTRLVIKGVGARNGMIILRTGDDVWAVSAASTHLGYGSSVIAPPPSDDNDVIESYRKVFDEWGCIE